MVKVTRMTPTRASGKVRFRAVSRTPLRAACRHASDRECFVRRAFIRAFGQPAQSLRRAARAS
jgi:hypothetical protein